MRKTPNNRHFKRKVTFFFSFFLLILLSPPLFSAVERCPGADNPPPPVLSVDIPKIISVLESLRDADGDLVWKTTPERKKSLTAIFRMVPQKTKLEQFFQLLYLIQEQVAKKIPVMVEALEIKKLLLEARVFTTPDFPNRIRAVILKKEDQKDHLRYQLYFKSHEARFPINGGKGFATWEQGMCQRVKELVFYDGFSFHLRKKKRSRNLVVEDFEKVQLFGDFGSRKVFKIDLNYTDLERVEFIEGTDEGKVKARVAKREFKENKHSFLFRFVGRLIPNSSRQRIDW